MDDDEAYRRSERNMALVLGAIVIVIFAALFLPPLISPVHESFQQTAATTSPYGFTLNIELNSTTLVPGSAAAVSAWMNSTDPQPNNVTSASSWAVGPEVLWTKPCTSGWPLGVGVMRGYYSSQNYTLGSLVRFPEPLQSCPVPVGSPSFFLLQPYGTVALAELGTSVVRWDLRSTLVLVPGSLPSLQPGVYTAVAADEWGDVALTHFRVSG